MTTKKKDDATGADALVKRMEGQLDRLLEWVRASESRIAMIVPLSTAMLGALAVNLPQGGGWTIWGGIAVSFAIVPLALSLAFAAFAAFPRTSGPKGSLVFFGGIASRELEQYRSAAKGISDSEYIDDLLNQCHRNAQIAEQKYLWIKRSMACLFTAAAPWVIALIILFKGGSNGGA